jgi:hypothetical protein
MLDKVNFDMNNDKDVVVEDDDMDLPAMNNSSTLTGSGSNNFL